MQRIKLLLLIINIMKLDVLLVNLIMVSLVVVPYCLFLLYAKNHSNTIKSFFQRIVKNNELEIDWKDSWNKNMIGVDSKKMRLLIVQDQDEISYHLIDLRDLKRSEIRLGFKAVKVHGLKEDMLQTLILELLKFSGEIQEILLFDTDKTYGQDYELLHAERLNKKINSLLEEKPYIHTAA